MCLCFLLPFLGLSAAATTKKASHPATASVLKQQEALEKSALSTETNTAKEEPHSPSASQHTEFVAENMIQTASLEALRPLFVPTHPRVTTTLRFPSAIGAPEGRGFTEDDSKVPGEYLVSWTRGEAHLTVTPLGKAGALNLNIPYEGETYVFYFFPVERQFEALTSLRLSKGPPAKTDRSSQLRPDFAPAQAPSASQLLGLLDKMKVIRATNPGSGQKQLAKQLGIQLGIQLQPSGHKGAAIGEVGTADQIFEVQLLFVAKDQALNALGFHLRLTNRGKGVTAPDSARCLVKCGKNSFPCKLIDGPGILGPSETGECFVIIENESLQPLGVENTWDFQLPSLLAAKGLGGIQSDQAQQDRVLQAKGDLP